MQQNENNKLIAEFMGYSQPHPEYPNTTYWYKKGEQPLVYLSFNSDWNWLMKVVEKIESHGLYFEIKKNWVKITKDKNGIVVRWEQDKTKIEAVYNACIEFIKWYNQQNKAI